jgi:methionyl-tRNA formyltransferase
MKITLLCSDLDHPVNHYLRSWMAAQLDRHEVELLRTTKELSGGDLLFLISCSEVVKRPDRRKFQVTLVLHASDLPKGRGWSPHVWELATGAQHITLSLIEAEDQVDTGKIWAKRQISIPKDALFDEINHLLFSSELKLIDWAVENLELVKPAPQSNPDEATYYPKRTPLHSQIDPNRTIAEQFDQIRVCHPTRFPAFFELHGQKYKLLLEKIDDKSNQD